MKISVNKEVFEKLPGLKLVFVKATGLENISKVKESLHLLKEAEHMVHLTFHKENVRNHYLISPWAVAREDLGKKARHYHTSVERLLQKVLHHRSISAKDTLTNLVRYLSIKHILPLGIDDITTIDGDVTFALASGKEKTATLKKANPGDLYYHDDKKVLGTKMDYWKSKKTALEPISCFALIHLEILPPVTPQMQKKVVTEMEGLVRAFCGGETKIFVLSKGKRQVKI